MKKILLTILLLSISHPSVAQSQKFFDAPFGLGIGFTPSFYFTDFEAINSLLSTYNYQQFSQKGIFTTGVSGYIYIGFIKNLRIGGTGFGGMVSNQFSTSVADYQVDYSINGGGVTLEYTLPFIKDWGVSVGTIIGGSNLTMEFFKNSGSYSWNDLFGNLSQNNLTRIERTSWMIAPTLNIDYPVYRFISLRLGAGYLYSFGGTWRANNNVQISDVPDKLNSKSFFIQLGIFGGFFSF